MRGISGTIGNIPFGSINELNTILQQQNAPHIRNNLSYEEAQKKETEINAHKEEL